MTGGPIPRLTPYQVLQVIDQMRLEADQTKHLPVWKHSGVCDGFTEGIWEPDASCRVCSFEVKYPQHIEQYLLMPVEEPAAATEPRCFSCGGRGVVPDFSRWNDYHGEPEPKPCPACAVPEPPC